MTNDCRKSNAIDAYFDLFAFFDAHLDDALIAYAWSTRLNAFVFFKLKTKQNAKRNYERVFG